MRAKDYPTRKLMLQNLLEKLCKQYGVNTPKLKIEVFDSESLKISLYGYYSDFDCGYIHLNFEKVNQNLAEAMKTLRHEFFHHLQYQLGLCDRWTKKGSEDKRRLETLARQFENHKRAGINPKTQTLLT